MSFTPYNAPLLGSLLGDNEAAGFFSIKADIKAMLDFETSLARAQSKFGMISKEAANEIVEKLDDFEPDIKTLSKAASKDGMVVPELINMLRNLLSDEATQVLHFKSTSQDVIDTSAMIRMKACNTLIISGLEKLITSLEKLAMVHSENEFMAYTRMQAALISKAGERIDSWLNPLKRVLVNSKNLRFQLQLGGPVASSSAYDGKLHLLAQEMAIELGLSTPAHVWHNDRSSILEIGTWLSTLTGHLGKMGTDICLMAQMGEEQIKLSGGGGSSAMAHKKNPVMAETLVTFAQFNATQMSGLHQSLVHEQERSGASWMVEWMIMPQLFVTTSAALRNANRLIESIQHIGKAQGTKQINHTI